MIPMQMRRFRLNRASAKDARWLRDRLDRESRSLGCEVQAAADGNLELRW
jgi:poly-gamma-glutamate synthesis protein (capsule biosynthesis protein)